MRHPFCIFPYQPRASFPARSAFPRLPAGGGFGDGGLQHERLQVVLHLCHSANGNQTHTSDCKPTPKRGRPKNDPNVSEKSRTSIQRALVVQTCWGYWGSVVNKIPHVQFSEMETRIRVHCGWSQPKTALGAMTKQKSEPRKGNQQATSKPTPRERPRSPQPPPQRAPMIQ